jgi:adenosylcobinamide kinase/adenosylcobinamide-phosphate guanylyltransferase
VAEGIARDLTNATGAAVTYVATGIATDDAMAARIAAHRARRPVGWATLEIVDTALMAPMLSSLGGVALLDSLGTWVAAAPDLQVDAAGLVDALRSRAGDAVVVSEEVGLSVHPGSQAGRQFVDALGDLNQAVAAAADRVLLVVAGRTIEV